MERGARQFLTVLLTLFVAVMIVFWYIGKTNPDHSNNGQEEKGGIVLVREDQEALSELSKKDTDGDGLLDWQEVLWGTDELNPDTDGDGTKDGIEVADSRDPNKSGPDDKIEVVALNLEEDFRDNPTLTTTDIVARELFSNYTLLSNPNLNLFTQDQVFSEVLDKSTKDLRVSRDISSKVTSGNLPSDHETYANSVALLFLNEVSVLEENELVYFEQLVSGDPSGLDKLNFSKSSYERLAIGIEAQSVPSDLLSFHTEIIVSLREISEGLKNMSAYQSDPLRSALGYDLFKKGRDGMYRGFSGLRNTLVEEGLSFKSSDPAYIFYFI